MTPWPGAYTFLGETRLKIFKSAPLAIETAELPGTVQQDKVKAKFRDGILEITIPKAEEAKPKQIKVDVS